MFNYKNFGKCIRYEGTITNTKDIGLIYSNYGKYMNIVWSKYGVSKWSDKEIEKYRVVKYV